MNKLFLLIIILISISIESCSKKYKDKNTFIIENILSIDRSFETVEIRLDSFDITPKNLLEKYIILELETNKKLITQNIDTNNDGKINILLFQPEINRLSEKQFKIVLNEFSELTDSTNLCYSRFVPERTDDYAWENNKVAFRTFGPTAQKMIEKNIEGGTLTSGIDAWLKKVEYPIINKWYKKTIFGSGSYHKDTGEGFDNFHVGVSRGVGGVAIKKDSIYYVSNNFEAWKTLYNGPIRTSFILTYANWDVDGNIISEEKHISLDYGSNLSKFEIQLTGSNVVSVGLTLHEQYGKTTVNIDQGWLSYWEPNGNSELGTGIVVPKNTMIGYEKYITQKKDESNLYAHLKNDNNKIIYYAGFGWKESNQFKSKEEWEAYLSLFAKKIKNPLIVKIKK